MLGLGEVVSAKAAHLRGGERCEKEEERWEKAAIKLIPAKGGRGKTR